MKINNDLKLFVRNNRDIILRVINERLADFKDASINDPTVEEGETTPQQINTETGEPEITPEPEKVGESKQFRTLDAQKRYWREKAEEAEEKLKNLKPPVAEDGDFWKKKVDFLLENQDKRYSEDEFEHISTVSQRKGVSLSDAAKSEDGYIKFLREKVAGQNKVPAPGSSSPFATIEKSPKEL